MITFVTGNQNKLLEVQMLLQGFDLQSHKIDLPEIQGTYAEIVAAKAAQAALEASGPVVVDDTALEFAAWGEFPGPYIKWLLKSLPIEQLPRTLDSFSKSAFAVATVGYCPGPGQPVKVFVGRTAGTIVDARGPTTFGWDCVFQPEGFSTTYAEMSKPEKNAISHRAKAFGELKKYLEEIKQ